MENKHYESNKRWRSNNREKRSAQRKRYYNKTSFSEKSHKPWSVEEIEMVLEHSVSDSELSETICRSVQSIQIARCRFKDRVTV